MWRSSAPLQPPAGTFYRAVNVGGPAAVVDGHNWEAETTSNYVTNSDPNPFSLRNSQGSIVPATVTYDATTRTVRLQPSSALNASSNYTATVKGGSTGLSDLAGNRLANDFVWSFSTGTGGSQQAATPTFSPPGGTYSTAQSVTISDTSSGVSIYYTTDGSTPTTASPRYTAPILVSTTTTIKAIAAGSGWTNSAVGSATYTIQIPTTPAAPSSLNATAPFPNQVNLSWIDNASNETAFLLERKIGSGGTYAQIASLPANTTFYYDTTVANSTTYFYRVRANNSNGSSAYSNEASVTTPGASSVSSPWSDRDIGSTGIAGSATYLNGSFTINGSGADIWGTADAFHFVYQPLSGNGEIIARVVSVGNTDPWAKAGVMIRDTINSNAKHAMMVVTPGNGVSFQRRTTTGGSSTDTTSGGKTAPYWVRLVRSGSTITAYYSSNGTSWTQIGSASISLSTTAQWGLAVTAHNNSALCTAVIDNVSVGTSLGTPSDLTVVAATSSQINLSWADHSTTETGFKIERKTGSGGTYAQIATVGTNVTSYSSTGLSAGTTYYYRVRAYTSSSNSAYSNEANATTLVDPPSPPSGLTATATSSSQINLAWTDVANETGYKIERKTGAGGSYSQIATVGAGVVSYSNTGLTANTAYFYRVRATNSAGDSSYSNEANATTLDTTPTAPSGLIAGAVSSTQINLSWTDNSSNETGFKIERKTGSGGTYAQIATTGAGVTTYNDTGLTASTTYFYRVRATNAVGDSAYSAEASATTATLPPAAPSALNASAASSSQINLTWTDNASNETGFRIERKTGSGGTYSEIATVGANVVSYSRTGLAANTTYYYRVRATNAGGDSAYSNEANATTLDAAPASPTALGATPVSTSQINLSWTDNASNETGFKIERKTGAGGTYAQIATTGANVTTYNDTGLSTATNYYYRVRATNSIGDSTYSNEANATTLDTVPAAPSGLTANAASSSQIDLSWTDNASNETGFKIERKTGSGGTYSQIGTVGAGVVTYSDSGLTPSTTYYYRVRATNSAGDSAYSAEAFATTPAAPATGLQGDYFDNIDFTAYTLSRLDAMVDFNWGSGSPDPSIGADTFSVRWTGQVQPQYSQTYTFYTNSDDGVRLWVNGQLIVDNWTDHGPTENSGTIALTANQRYDIVMTYYENGGGAVAQLSWSSTSQAKQIIPSNRLFPVPAAPINLAASAVSSSQINLSWTDNSSNESGFKIERKTGSGGTYAQIATVGAGVTSYNDTGLSESTAYYYRIRATNGSGDSAYSNEANATTPASPAAAPSGLTATAVSSSQINLTWSDNSSNETGFKIERKTGSGGTYTQIATVGANVVSYSSTGLAPNTTYFFRVRATNAGGDSAYSNEANATTPNAAPAAPSALAATAISTSQINLSWTDNASNETGFKIERKTGSGGTYAQIATTGADVTSYNDTGLSATTTYYYRVRATNSIGDSAYSNEANATTSSPLPAAPSGLTASASSSTQIDLAWVDNATNETGFKIERKTGSGGTYSQIATVGAGVVGYSNTGLTPGTSYYYRVRATNATGDSAYSNEANTTSLAAPAFRAAASKAAASGSLVINKPTGTVQNDVMVASIAVRPNTATITAPSGWTLVRRTNNTNSNPNSLATYYKVAGSSEPTTYTWTLGSSAGAAGGIETFSGVNTSDPIDVEAGQNTANAVTLTAPSVTTTSAYEMLVTSHAFASSATFTKPTGMTEAFDIASVTVPNSGGEAIEGNYQSLTSAGATGSKTATASGDADVGNAHTLALNGVTLSPPLTAPGNLTATATSTTQISLSWVDNATNETGYKIERKTGAGGTYAQIATVGANATSYNDTGLTTGTTYFYRVRATSSSGDSAYSNEASATTLLSVPSAPTGLSATAISSSQINLSWSDVANETGFKIERKTGSGGTYAQIGTTGANVTTYNDTGLTAGTTYFYRVRATNASGDSSYSNETSATTVISPPNAPSGLTATATSSTQINLSWTDVANETGFKIERKTGAGGSYSQIATVGTGVVSYSNTGLTGNTTYYYRIRATNAGGDSPYSTEANATTLDVAPAAPSGLSATSVSTSQINLTWTDNSSNETGFKIERKTGSGGTYAQVATTGAGATTYNDTGLTAATTYFYRVRATNAVGDSAYSAEASATTGTVPPDTPSGLMAAATSSSQINLSWTDVATETGFKIERKTGVGGTYSQIATVGGGVVTYSNTGLTANTTYYYRIRATNAGGDSPYSTEANATTLDVAPAAPSGLSATSASTTQINLSWTDNATNETGFKIERKTGSGGTYAQIATTGADVTTYNDPGLTEGTTYFYRVRATNAIGDSAYSGEASATTGTTPPDAPSGLTATPISSSQINLSWTDVANETGYKIERKTGAGGTYSQVATVGAGVITYSNTGLTVNTTYYYRVRATNAGGDSPYSNEANTTTLDAIPAAPSGLAATAVSTSQINLSWVDNATNETGFKIERKTGSGGTYAQIATVGTDVTSYNDTGLSGTTTYYYRVRATNAIGDSSYSNEANATTSTAIPAAPSDLTATAASSSQIDLAWTDNATNETGFKIERKIGAGGTYSQIATVAAGVVAYSDTGLVVNTTYYYRVRATNAGGDSAYSDEAHDTTLNVIPPAPSGLVATAVSTTQINLSWTSNSVNETGFKIERKTGAGGTYSQIATVGAGVVTYNDTGLATNTTYFYRVRATNAVGDSAYSNEASATTQLNPPAAPSGLTATAASTTQINLTWTDNSSDETGFKIERKTGAGGTYAQIATVGASVTTYSNTGLVVGTNYFYRVRATNTGGDSAYSNTASATTLTTLWPDTAVPAVPDQMDGVLSTELGVRFNSDRSGWITGLRFYKTATNTGVHTGHLWTNDGTLLATVTFTNETASGWQTATFSTPVAITAGTPYVASYYSQSRHFSYDSGYFVQSHDQAPLHALADGVAGPNGLWHDDEDAFPTDSDNAINFWVDVVFSDDGP